MPVHRIVSLIALLFAAATMLSLAVTLDIDAEGAGGDRLAPELAVERELASGQRHAYRLDPSVSGLWLISAEQLGIDLELVLLPAEGDPIVTDSPLDRAGTESLLVRTEAGGSVQIEVRARERAAPPGRYRILLEGLSDDGSKGRLRVDSEGIRTAAAQHYAAGRTRQALASYLGAAELWRKLDRPADQARDLYCAAVLHRLVGETHRALELDQRVLAAWRQLGERFWEAATLNEIGLNRWTLGESGAALASYGQALELRRAIGDSLGAIHTRTNICVAHLTKGELRQGRDCYQEVFGQLDEEEEPEFAAALYTNAGWTSDRLGDPDAALEHYQQALSLSRLAGDRRGEARASNNLAWLLHGTGRLEEALERYQTALEIFVQLQDPRWQGIVLNNIGIAYAALGEPRRGLTFLDRALGARRRSGHRRGEAATHDQLGLIHRHLGQLPEALGHHRQALEVVRELEDPRQLAILLRSAAETRAASGEQQLALQNAERALELSRQVEDRPNEAAALHLVGGLRVASGEIEAGLASLGKALNLRRAIRDLPGQAETLTSLARAERHRGRLDKARAHVEDALVLIEDLRAEVSSTDLRATFQSTHRRAYELHVDILMALHQVRPEGDHHRLALAASEKGRARALVDLLSESGREIQQGIESDLRQQREQLERRLNGLAARQTALLSQPQEGGEVGLVERKLGAILHRLERVEARIRATSPRYAELTRPRTLDAEEIQALLDPDTVLLHYGLGEERSFLWWVTPDELTAYELPRRAGIEAVARRMHDLLSSTQPRDRQRQASTAFELHRLLLAPVAHRLDQQRLVVVADGALHYLPFAALPGASPDQPLVARHEVTQLPSATVLGALRREHASRSPAPRGLAVVADPVFEPDDPRLSKVAESRARSGPMPGLNRPREPRFRRLPGSSREAQSIAALAAPEEVMLALGFEADRERLMGDRLRPYRMVHFATHGVIDARTPRLSGLVLSLFDEQGRPQEGFLRLHDLYDLELASELVVLSGCQTALGREIHGEGLVGMARGFMYAGASRVVASLWRVEDRSTAELMTRFYRSMADGLTPAAALRAAQLSLRQERRWKDPYYWAGFILLGEWRVPLSSPKDATTGAVVTLQ